MHPARKGASGATASPSSFSSSSTSRKRKSEDPSGHHHHHHHHHHSHSSPHSHSHSHPHSHSQSHHSQHHASHDTTSLHPSKRPRRIPGSFAPSMSVAGVAAGAGGTGIGAPPVATSPSRVSAGAPRLAAWAPSIHGFNPIGRSLHTHAPHHHHPHAVAAAAHNQHAAAAAAAAAAVAAGAPVRWQATPTIPIHWAPTAPTPTAIPAGVPVAIPATAIPTAAAAAAAAAAVTNGTVFNAMPIPQGLANMRFVMHEKDAPKILGKENLGLDHIRLNSGANIQRNNNDRHSDILLISGTPETVGKAFELIAWQVYPRQSAIPNSAGDPSTVMIQLLIHGSQIGCIIGKRGSRINLLRKTCNAKIVNRDYPGSEDQAVWVTGKPEDIKKVTTLMAVYLSRQNPSLEKGVVWTAPSKASTATSGSSGPNAWSSSTSTRANGASFSSSATSRHHSSYQSRPTGTILPAELWTASGLSMDTKLMGKALKKSGYATRGGRCSGGKAYQSNEALVRFIVPHKDLSFLFSGNSGTPFGNAKGRHDRSGGRSGTVGAPSNDSSAPTPAPRAMTLSRSAVLCSIQSAADVDMDIEDTYNEDDYHPATGMESDGTSPGRLPSPPPGNILAVDKLITIKGNSSRVDLAMRLVFSALERGRDTRPAAGGTNDVISGGTGVATAATNHHDSHSHGD